MIGSGLMNIRQALAVIRYETALLHADAKTKNDILKYLKPMFPIHEFNKELNAFVCFEPKKKIKCIIYEDNIVIDIEELEFLYSLKSWINDIVPRVLRFLDVNQTSFIGVRVFYIPVLEQEKSIVNSVISKNFFSNSFNNYLQHSLQGEFTSPHIGFSAKLDAGLTINVKILTNQQVEGELLPGGKMKVLKVNDTVPILDIDVYTDDIKNLDQISGVIKGASQKIEKYRDEIWHINKRGAIV